MKQKLRNIKEEWSRNDDCFSLDILNTSSELTLTDPQEEFFWTVFVSVYVNEHSKVIEFSYTPSKNIFDNKSHDWERIETFEESKGPQTMTPETS
jgi:hypothetical protein